MVRGRSAEKIGGEVHPDQMVGNKDLSLLADSYRQHALVALNSPHFHQAGSHHRGWTLRSRVNAAHFKSPFPESGLDCTVLTGRSGENTRNSAAATF